MTRVAVAVIGTNLVFDYGTPEAARLAMEALEAEAQSTAQPEAAGEAGLRALALQWRAAADVYAAEVAKGPVVPPDEPNFEPWERMRAAEAAFWRVALAATALPETTG